MSTRFKIISLVSALAAWTLLSGFAAGTILKAEDAAQYKVESKLGAGGLGDVFKVTRVAGGPQETLALKTVQKQHSGDISRIILEAHKTFMKFCNNSCGRGFHAIKGVTSFTPTADAGGAEISGILSELADGDAESLSRYIRLSRQNPSPMQRLEALAVLYNELGEAIAKLSGAGYAHNDIKPANFLIVGDKVALADYDGLLPVGSPFVFATVAYSGIEYFIRAGAQATTDYFALGNTFMEWMMGKFALQAYEGAYEQLHGKMKYEYQPLGPKAKPYDSATLEVLARSIDGEALMTGKGYPVAILLLGKYSVTKFLSTPPKMLPLRWKVGLGNALDARKAQLLEALPTEEERQRFGKLYDALAAGVVGMLDVHPGRRIFTPIGKELLPNRDALVAVLEQREKCK